MDNNENYSRRQESSFREKDAVEWKLNEGKQQPNPPNNLDPRRNRKQREWEQHDRVEVVSVACASRDECK